jgi:hypothetical protein
MSSRADLSRFLPMDSSLPLKTFVLEVHTDEPEVYLEDLAGRGNVDLSEDAFLSRVRLRENQGVLWVDRLNPRFWSFHTIMPAKDAADWLSGKVEARRDLDWMWLPSDHLRRISPGALSRKVRTVFDGERLVGPDDAAQDLKVQLTGSNAERLLEQIAKLDSYRSAVSFDSVEVLIDDPDLGVLREAVKRRGSFAASGDSFVHHAQFVRAVIDRYSYLVEAVERLALRFDLLDGGGDDDVGHEIDESGVRYSGTPIGIEFSRRILDLPRFCAGLFNSRHPFRLWGQPVIVGDIATVDAVDLHVGQRVRIDVGPSWMRIYIRAGSCGNTVARLVSNLQSRFDGALRLTHSGLRDAVTRSAPIE